MSSVSRLFRVGSLVAALAAAPGLAAAAGMGGVGGGGATGGGMMGGGAMNNMMMGPYDGSSTGSAVTDPNHRGATADPSIRNFSHTGLRNPLPVSKAWRDLPVSDGDAGGALTPVPSMPAAAGDKSP